MIMAMPGNVQQKISCVFETKVVEEKSSKRSWQPYKVVASDHLRQSALDANIYNALPSEKLDGTCVLIDEFEGAPWMWARHDQKPTKIAEKRFKKFQNGHRAWQISGKHAGEEEPFIDWDMEKDFKEVPPFWKPASGVKLKEGRPVPDNNSHIPGWVPIDPKSRTHCWHSSAVQLDYGIGLVLKPEDEDSTRLTITAMELSKLLGATMELIGTNVNGNPYKLGSKQQPLHMLVRHGSIPFHTSPPLDFVGLENWFSNDPEGQVEGVVWHCQNGTLFKVHRYHMGLKWPVNDLKLASQSVSIDVDISKYDRDFPEKSPFLWLAEKNEKQFDSISDLLQSTMV